MFRFSEASVLPINMDSKKLVPSTSSLKYWLLKYWLLVTGYFLIPTLRFSEASVVPKNLVSKKLVPNTSSLKNWLLATKVLKLLSPFLPIAIGISTFTLQSYTG